MQAIYNILKIFFNMSFQKDIFHICTCGCIIIFFTYAPAVVASSVVAVEAGVGSSHIQDILHSTNLGPVLLEHTHRFHNQGHIHNIQHHHHHHYSTGLDQPEAGSLARLAYCQ